MYIRLKDATPEIRAKEIEQRRRYYQNLKAKDPTYNARKAKAYKLRHPGKVGKCVDKWCHEHLPAHDAGCNARRLTKLKDHCEFCGQSPKILVRHHFDYTKPLDVTTLCAPCHKAIHQVMKMYGFQEPTEYIVGSRHCDNCLKTWPSCGRGVPSTGKSPNATGKRNCVRWQGLEPPEIVLGDYLLEEIACKNQSMEK